MINVRSSCLAGRLTCHPIKETCLNLVPAFVPQFLWRVPKHIIQKHVLSWNHHLEIHWSLPLNLDLNDMDGTKGNNKTDHVFNMFVFIDDIHLMAETIAKKHTHFNQTSPCENQNQRHPSQLAKKRRWDSPGVVQDKSLDLLARHHMGGNAIEIWEPDKKLWFLGFVKRSGDRKVDSSTQ